jgi:hypothetical protein
MESAQLEEESTMRGFTVISNALNIGWFYDTPFWHFIESHLSLNAHPHPIESERRPRRSLVIRSRRPG